MIDLFRGGPASETTPVVVPSGFDAVGKQLASANRRPATTTGSLSVPCSSGSSACSAGTLYRFVERQPGGIKRPAPACRMFGDSDGDASGLETGRAPHPV